MIEMSDLLPIILEKSSNRKIPWENLDQGGFTADFFDVSLWLSASTVNNRTVYRLNLRDANGNSIATISASLGATQYEILERIYQESAKTALKYDENVISLKNALDRL